MTQLTKPQGKREWLVQLTLWLPDYFPQSHGFHCMSIRIQNWEATGIYMFHKLVAYRFERELWSPITDAQKDALDAFHYEGDAA